MLQQPWQKNPWNMTPDEWADSVGASKPMAGFGVDASLTQLSRMSDNERRSRSEKRQRELKAYKTAVGNWEEFVWKSYLEKKFSADEVFDTDAFYVLSERIGKVGISMHSPFRLSRMSIEERMSYLVSLDAQVQIGVTQ